MSNKIGDYVDKLFTYIEKNRSKFLDTLKNERKPISGAGEGMQQRALDWVSEKLRNAGAVVEPSEVSVKSPPVIRAVLGKARDKKTLLIYGHINPPAKGKEIVLFGNGITDSRGSLISLFTTIDVYKNVKIPLPVNLRFLFESMSEKNAEDFIKYLYRNSAAIFAGVDHVCVLDNRPNYFYGTKPLICWGLRGCCEFDLTIECASKNLNSGENGGAIQEAMTDLIVLLSCLVNSKGDILIPGINEDVVPLTPQEEKEYHKATFDVDRYKNLTGAHTLLHKEEKKRILLHMTRFPSLSIHSVRSQAESNDENIPSSATGKFSIRIVPDQTVNAVQENVTDYLTRMMSIINSSNKISIKMIKSSPPWITNPKDSNVQACIRALKRVYKDEPELIREGSTIPILTELQKNSGKDVLLFPVGRVKCHAPGNTEENIFFDTTRSLCSYFYELSR